MFSRARATRLRTAGSRRSRQVAPVIREALAATIVAGAAVALAPALPGAFRMFVLVTVLAAWSIWMLVVGVRLVPALLRRPPDAVGWIAAATAGLGALFVALGVTEYWLVRGLTGREALSWSIDWRGHWNHAQAVARSGGVSDALDLAGEPISYHVGSAWFAGAVEVVFGGGLHTTLFAVVPLLSVAAVFLALTYLVRREVRLPWRAAGAAVGITLALPALNAWIMRTPWELVDRGLRGLLNPQIWWAPTVMLNALLGLAAGLAGLALLLDRDSPRVWRIVGAAGLAVVITLKPQYFIGLGAVAGVAGVARVVGAGPFRPPTPAPLLAALGALGIAVVLLVSLPGFDAIFQAPVLRPGQTVYPGSALVRELGGLHVLMLVIGLGAWLIARRSPDAPGSPARSPLELALLATAAFVLVALGLYTLELPFRPEIVERGAAVGIPDAEALQQNNLIQSLIPLRILVALAGVALLVRLVIAYRRSGLAVAGAVIGLLAVFAPTPYMLYAARNPDKAFDAAADPGLYTVLERIPRSEELIIASDLADPADDWYRPLNAELMPAYHGHRFYVANLRFQHWIKESAAERLENLQRFFGTRWTPWHESFLARTGVTHVLVNERCPAAWRRPPVLQPVERAGAWTAYVVAPIRPVTGARRPAGPIDLEPRYGRAACLAMLSRPGGRAWGERGEGD